MRNLWSLIFLSTFYVVVGCQTISGRSKSNIQTTPSLTQDAIGLIVTIDPGLSLGSSPTAYSRSALILEPVPDEIMEIVRNDLLERTGAEPERIHILETESVDWPDSSLGCGQPGEVYMPVITPGFRILLEAEGQAYSYHTNTTNHFILCETPKPILINSTPSR